MGKPPVLDTASDEELAAQAQAGLRASFEELVYRYSRRLTIFIRQRIGTDPDTEDLVQETFLKAYRNIHRFDSAYKFSTWLYTMAARLVIGFYRKNKPFALPAVPAIASPDPMEALVGEEDSRRLWDLARRLSPDQFQALWLRYMEGMPLKDMAGVMKKSQVHVRVLLHRARLRLGKWLDSAVSEEVTKKTEPVGRVVSGKFFVYSKKENSG